MRVREVVDSGTSRARCDPPRQRTAVPSSAGGAAAVPPVPHSPDAFVELHDQPLLAPRQAFEVEVREVELPIRIVAELTGPGTPVPPPVEARHRTSTLQVDVDVLVRDIIEVFDVRRDREHVVTLPELSFEPSRVFGLEDAG